MLPRRAFVTRLQICLCVNPFTVKDRIPTEVVLAGLRPAKETPCIPFSQVLGWLSWFNRTRITSHNEDYQQPDMPERHTQSRRISDWLFAVRFSHRQAIHVPLHYRHKSHKDNIWWTYSNITRMFSIQCRRSQFSTTHRAGPSMHRPTRH